ncbi:MAG: hypothetical protein KDC92_08550 [Bacteroidetes bacterium]|nr:hypothetical protein [Bacteroidota bacterium]
MKRVMKSLTAFIIMLFVANSVMAQKDYYEFPKNKADSTKCVENINIFDNQFNNKNFTQVPMKAWRWCYKNAPKSNKLIYQWGDDIYSDYARQYSKEVRDAYKAYKTSNSDEDKAAFYSANETYNKYVDTLIMVNEQRMKVFGQYEEDSATSSARIAIALYTHRKKEVEDLNRIVEMIQIHNRIAGEKRIYAMPVFQFGAIDQLVKADQIDTSEIVDIYVKQIDFIRDKALEEDAENVKILEENGGDSTALPKQKWTKSLSEVEAVMNKYLTCKVLVPLYERMVASGQPLKKRQLQNMVSMLQLKRCDDSDVYFTLAQNLCDIEPNSSCNVALGDKALKDGKFADAKTYYQKALDLEKESKVQQASIWLKIAGSEQRAGSCSNAIASAKKAVALNPKLGNAYLIMAACYTTIARASCKEDFDRAASNWVIVDYYYKAKVADPSLSATCNSRIASHSEHFPTKEDLFFKEIPEGTTYTVPCLSVSTTVRAKK